jgi:CubicO group peptidase (beta-lactamase class C family)
VVVIAAILVSTCGSSSPTLPAQDLLSRAFETARRIEGMRSLLVSQEGRLVAEEYFNGIGPQRLHDVRSVTKSVTSALVGIAIDQGFIESTDQTLDEFLVGPVLETLDEEWAGVTLESLLTMTGGHEWSELGGSSEFPVWISSPDQINYILSKPVVSPPGTRFDYSDGGAHLVSVILSVATGMSALDFAQRHLFEPLGVDGTQWPVDNRGYNIGGAGLQISPRGMLAFGNLYLNGGTSGGRRIVPSEWVTTSTRTHVSTGNALPYGPGYGYFWWRGSASGTEIYYATGYGGQFILLVPESRLVVVATCEWRYPISQANSHWSAIMNVMVDEILPVME